MIVWRTLEDGRVWTATAGSGAAPWNVASGDVRLLTEQWKRDRLSKVAKQWGTLLASQSARTGVPCSWLLAVVCIESSGVADAEGAAGEVGLFQLMPVHWGGRTAAEMKDPERNASAGAGLLAALMRSPGTLGELPAVASEYNCGASKDGTPKVQSSSDWGMCAAPGYISEIVATNNQAIVSGLNFGGRVSSAATRVPPAPAPVALPAWFVGDSLTVGMQPSLTSSPAVAARVWAIGGKDTRTMLGWFASHAQRFDGAPVHVMGGTNDLNNGRTPSDVLGTLGQIADAVRSWGGLPVVSTIPQFKGHEAARDALNALIVSGAARGAWALSRAGEAASPGPDGVHPDGTGYRAMSNVAIASTIAARGPLASAPLASPWGTAAPSSTTSSGDLVPLLTFATLGLRLARVI